MYSSNTETNLHFVEVSGPGASVYTAVTQPPSECDTNSGSTSEGVFLRGLTTTLTINPASQADTDSYTFVVSNGGGSVRRALRGEWADHHYRNQCQRRGG